MIRNPEVTSDAFQKPKIALSAARLPTSWRRGLQSGVGMLVLSMAIPAVLAQTVGGQPGAAPTGVSSMGNPLNRNPVQRDAEIPEAPLAPASAPVVESDPRNSTSRPAERQSTATPDPRNSTSRPTPMEGRPASEVD